MNQEKYEAGVNKWHSQFYAFITSPEYKRDNSSYIRTEKLLVAAKIADNLSNSIQADKFLNIL